VNNPHLILGRFGRTKDCLENIKWLWCVQSHVVEEDVEKDVESDGEAAEAEWLLQLEDLLFSSAPSERNKAKGETKYVYVL